MAEVDGNRTRLTGIACHARFEGGGAHQEPRHLRPSLYAQLRIRVYRVVLFPLGTIHCAPNPSPA
jgi:hypothetical protein